MHWWIHGGPTDLDNLILLCPSHHRAVHEVGYTVRALGDGRFAFTRPDGTPVSETPQLEPLPTRPNPFTGAPMVGPSRLRMPEPTWGGEQLDLAHLIDGMAANYIIATGRHLPDVPMDDLSRTVREATGWPMTADRSGDRSPGDRSPGGRSWRPERCGMSPLLSRQGRSRTLRWDASEVFGQQHEGVRLAELVAALSPRHRPGVRPADGARAPPVPDRRSGSPSWPASTDEDRAGAYYTALLVNVGCHTDAHEQAKWFGDDIALKADKYDLRDAQPARRGGRRAPHRRGQPPLHRFRIGLEFAISAATGTSTG